MNKKLSVQPLKLREFVLFLEPWGRVETPPWSTIRWKHIENHISTQYKKLTHLPMTHFQPMIQDSSQEWDLMWAPFNTVHRFIQTPSSITTLGPIVTFGPILQFFPIFALGSWKEKHEVKNCHMNCSMCNSEYFVNPVKKKFFFTPRIIHKLD